MYAKRFKVLKKITGRWRDLPCAWDGTIDKVREAVLPKAIYRLDAIPPITQHNSSQIVTRKLSASYGTRKSTG